MGPAIVPDLTPFASTSGPQAPYSVPSDMPPTIWVYITMYEPPLDLGGVTEGKAESTSSCGRVLPAGGSAVPCAPSGLRGSFLGER